MYTYIKKFGIIVNSEKRTVTRKKIILRKGEKMRLRRVHNMLIASALVCSMVVTPVFAEPSSAREEEAQLKEQKEAAQDELDDLQTELNDLISKANQLELDLIAKGEEIIQAEEDLKVAEAKKDEQYEAMKLRIKYMYESGSGTATMEKVMTSGDISSILSQAEYSQQVHEYDRDQLDEYANTVKEIEDLQDTLETERANLEELEAENEVQQKKLNETINDKKDDISNLDEMIQEAAQRAEAEEEAARQINEARDSGHRVICVGTTSCRTVESAADETGRLRACSGWTEIFIYPGYRFKVLDGLITNFHLPESTLIMLVSALAGREHVLAAYEEAVRERYRFFSFGDAMLII